MAETELNCLYQYYLTNHIHKLILQNDSKYAVDDALMHLKKVLDEHDSEEKLKVFIDARAGVPPLQHLFSQLRKLYATYDKLPEIRSVFVYEGSVLLSVIQVFFNALGINASRRFIKGGTDIEAQDWLLFDDDA